MARRWDDKPAQPWTGAPQRLLAYDPEDWDVSPEPTSFEIVDRYGDWLDARCAWWLERYGGSRDDAASAAGDDREIGLLGLPGRLPRYRVKSTPTPGTRAALDFARHDAEDG